MHLAFSIALLFLPSALKIVVLRSLGSKIGKDAYIGFSIIHAGHVHMGETTYIGHLNLIWKLTEIRMASGSRVSHLNWITGGGKGRFFIGRNSSASRKHFFDASADIHIGDNTIVAGIGSQFFTHGITPDNLDQREPIRIGDWSYIGSAVKCIPGVDIPNGSFVGMGSIVTRKFHDPHTMIAGCPAKVVKTLDPKAAFFSRRFLPQPHHKASYKG